MKLLKTLFSLIMTFLLIPSCGQGQNSKDMHSKKDKTPNKLIEETSPYLLQHAYNPVDWHAWNAETLEKGKKENKLLIISVGYAACHWCHVMEHESFEDVDVASKMNNGFLPIKVDREERPDVDQIYMTAAYITTGRGGWPLNAIALPDGRPVFAGTYFPKESWLQVLHYFTETFRNEPQKLYEQADKITQGIRSIDQMIPTTNTPVFTEQLLHEIWNNWQSKIDYKWGGRNGAPKFMMPNNWDYLLRYYHISKNEKVLQAINTTLNRMAQGGLYDHVGGGFARYSTDEKWKVPHFEKMLYDNGQLVSLYSKAYQLTKNEYYKEIVEETLNFTQREMTDASSGFYSSLDADSEGEEGKFYVWTTEELDFLWGSNSKMLKAFYNIKPNGNWEHTNVLFNTIDKTDFAKDHNIDLNELNTLLNKSKSILLQEREKRIKPGLDDKILTSWNALMLKGYVDAYRAFGDASYLKSALKNAHFLVNNQLQNDGRLNRNYKKGRSTINAFLIDYSLTIEAFIALYEVTFDETWLNLSQKMATYTLEHFYDDKSKMFFYTSDIDDPLISRSIETDDNVISASNSSMAKVLFLLGKYFYNDTYVEISKQMLNNVLDKVTSNGPFYANWSTLLSWFIYEPYEVAILGKDAEKVRKEMDEHYLPNVFFLGGEKEGNLALLKNKLNKGKTTIYVCQNKVCQLPTTKVGEALKQIR